MKDLTEDELTIIELLLIEKMGRYPQDLSHNGFDKLKDLYNKIITREVTCSLETNMFTCRDCGERFEELGQEPKEIYEWWIITGYLHRKLSEKGQPVLEWGNNCCWGRCCTGQAILLDIVISEICSDMEILEGKKNEWKN